MFVITGDDRKPQIDDKACGVINSLIAYTGRCRLEGEVEVVWNPE
jgi:hypothetical protein